MARSLVISGYDYTYSDAHPFQEVQPLIFKTIAPTTCLGCGLNCLWICYRWPRPAIGVCGPICLDKLEAIMKEGSNA